MSNHLMSFDSPIFPNQDAENSPMTNLALNFGETNIGLPARRKLALNDSTDSSLGSPMIVSPLPPPSGDRLLKSSLRFSTPGSQQRGGGGTPGAVTRRAVPRRLAAGLLGDENCNPNATTDLMNTSPAKLPLSPSKFQAVRQLSSGRPRQPLEDYDPNSQDSGYGISEDSKSHSSDFCFAQPSGLAPRRSNAESPRRPNSSSTDSLDDGFSDFIMPLEDEEAQLPSGLGDLIMQPIINAGITIEADPALALPPLTFTHCISENTSPIPTSVDTNKKRQSSTPLDGTPVSKRLKPLQETPQSQRTHQNTLFQYGFKRLAEPRPLLSHSLSLEESPTPQARPKFRHCLSESEAVIKRALHRSTEEELIGDFTRTFALPLVQGNHQDLKSITPKTLAQLINGEYSDTIASFQIVDCRYPYEYHGGHIRGALNIYTRDQVMKQFLESRTLTEAPEGSKRDIIVFHCEFSSERGPGLSRFLRSKDRETNAYPALLHPEVYLLEGGYKAFYIAHSELCEPRAYVKMVDADKEQLQHFRAKSKTWNGDRPSRTLKRSTSFKRLGL